MDYLTDSFDPEFRKPTGMNDTWSFLNLGCYTAANKDSAQTFINRVLQDDDDTKKACLERAS